MKYKMEEICSICGHEYGHHRSVTNNCPTGIDTNKYLETVFVQSGSGNFWDEIKKLYPEAFAHFSQWIDDYKKEINWDAIFAPGIKFHDLPYDIQNGIIARFDIEKFFGKNGYKRVYEAEPHRIRSLFKDVQRAINDRSVKNA